MNEPQAYLIYQLVWEEAEKQGALKGYPHFGKLQGAEYGLAVDLRAHLLNFLEVLQFERGVYDVWYDILNFGFRMTPTAGTDYPCFGSLPGRERFYTKVEGPLTYDTWLAGVRAGKTFVTNGPILDFRIDEKEIGDEVLLKKPGSVAVEGRVRFDARRDIVERLELIVNGEAVKSFPRKGEDLEISFKLPLEMPETSWVALRASGRKTDEVTATVPPFSFFGSSSLAHTAAIYVAVEGVPPLSARPQAKVLARKWLAKLQDLEARLQDDQMQHLARPAAPDGVDADTIRKNSPALLQAIQNAKQYFSDIAR